MKVGIIGTGGFLAKAIIDRFSVEKIDLLLLGRTKPGVNLACQFISLDLMTETLPIDVLSKCDVIIYTAGLGVQAGEKVNNEDVYTINTFVPIKLYERLRAIDFKGTCITFGSYFEIGSIATTALLSEKEIVTATEAVPNLYCFTKRMLSQYVNFTQFNFTYYHFILPTIYGNGENPNRLIPYTIEGFRSKKLLQFTAGLQVRQYLLVDDAAGIVLQCIRKGIAGGIYNFPAAETISVKELVKKIGNAYGIEVPEVAFQQVQRADTAMQTLQMSSNKLAGEISFGRLTTIEAYIQSLNY